MHKFGYSNVFVCAGEIVLFTRRFGDLEKAHIAARQSTVKSPAVSVRFRTERGGCKDCWPRAINSANEHRLCQGAYKSWRESEKISAMRYRWLSFFAT